jgi:hypothetical protein
MASISAGGRGMLPIGSVGIVDMRQSPRRRAAGLFASSPVTTTGPLRRCGGSWGPRRYCKLCSKAIWTPPDGRKPFQTTGESGAATVTGLRGRSDQQSSLPPSLSSEKTVTDVSSGGVPPGVSASTKRQAHGPALVLGSQRRLMRTIGGISQKLAPRRSRRRPRSSLVSSRRSCRRTPRAPSPPARLRGADRS